LINLGKTTGSSNQRITCTIKNQGLTKTTLSRMRTISQG